ncbi:rCG50874 [Rattus norvegicus]|uniref:RCG50874 n=1 Tax=Rattus norvegicus TaxID=10116 RepID=A6KJ02_RAT|nr:rCG50874 [Rattus norvegicus]
MWGSMPTLKWPTGHSSPNGGVPGVGFLAMFVTMMVSGGDDRAKKAHLVETAGIILMVVGLAALVACSWIGHGIVADFYNPKTPMNIQYGFGPAIYIGCVGSSLVILGGTPLPCS